MANILLCCSASVSVYKACDLASKLAQAGHTVRTALTANAARLVSPQLFHAVTGEAAHVSEWGEERRGAMDHIDLSRSLDLVVVAPCSADLAARLAHGMADDLVPVDNALATAGLLTSSEVTMELVEGAGHNDLLYVDARRYITSIAELIEGRR